MDLEDLPATALFWIAAGLLLALAAFAALMEHRRTRRRDLDRPGCMSWNLVQILALLLAIAAAGLALKG